MNQTDHVYINLVLIAKAPRPGYVKTRLHPSLSHAQACEVYEQFLFRARTMAEKWSRNRTGIRLFLAYDPPDQAECWANWSQWAKCPQSDGNLGDRMLAVLQSIAPAPADATIFIGADAPELSPHHLDWAIENLTTHDAVTVPAHDGGYVLIGIHSSAAVLFRGIQWGTDIVFSQTQQIAREVGLTLVHSLPISDVDNAEDLAGLLTRLLCSSDPSDRNMASTLMKITRN